MYGFYVYGKRTVYGKEKELEKLKTKLFESGWEKEPNGGDYRHPRKLRLGKIVNILKPASFKQLDIDFI